MINFMNIFKTSLVAIGLTWGTIVSFAAEKDIPTETTAFNKPLEINLKDLRVEAKARLEKVFGTLSDEGKIVFVDAYSSNGPGLIFDQARLYYITPLPKDKGVSSAPFASYYISPQGYSSIGFLDSTGEKEPLAFHPFGGAAVFREGTTAEAMAAKLEALTAKYPSLTIISYNVLRLITVELEDDHNPTAQNAADQAGLLAELAKDPDFDSWENQGEFFPIPYGFADPIQLGDGTEDQTVDVNSLRSLSLDTGLPTTLPSWPAPFGEGRIPNPEIIGHPTLDPVDVSIGH